MTVVSDNLVERFASLFDGYSRAYGQYRITGAKDFGKKEGVASTIKKQVTVDRFRSHLSGEDGLGVIPLRDDNSVVFAAIDIDIKRGVSVDVPAVAKKVMEKGLPLLTCLSKSKGAHLYLFCKEPIPAEIVRDRMHGWAAELGFGSAEIFPKQQSRANSNDYGNWINLPYFGGDETDRYAVVPPDALDLEEFLNAAERIKVSELDLHKPQEERTHSEYFQDGAPCLQMIEKAGGFGDGERNTGMYMVLWHLKQAYPDDWENKAFVYNEKFCQPPLAQAELRDLIKSCKRGGKNYGPKCKEPPMVQFCNKRECLRRKFGVGEGTGASGFLQIAGLTKYDGDPPIWFAEIEGNRVQLRTEELLSQAKFARVCVERVNRNPTAISKPKWDNYVDDLVRSADIVPMPEDASRKGQFFNLLEFFLYAKVKAKSRDDLAVGKPYSEDGKVYFTSLALFQFLNESRFRYEEQIIWGWLRDKNADHKVMKVRKKPTKVWILDEETFFAQSDEDDSEEQEPLNFGKGSF